MTIAILNGDVKHVPTSTNLTINGINHANGSLASSPAASPLAEPDPRRVLLVLDVQAAVFADPPSGVPSAHYVGQNVTRILNQARNAIPPPLIVHVRNTGDVGEPDEQDTPGWRLVNPVLPGEIVIDKRKNNAFAGTNLGDIVPIDAEVIMVGFQTDFAVRATCAAAILRGNEVLLIRGAHGTCDRIEVLHGGGIIPAARIVSEIETELEDLGVHLLDMKDLPGLFTDR
ncbi:hypothetical protein AX16_010120 [Volvariella volvacea WC 439]|nr:hypothetical protein AX16_010120 [Volvariella volvacea WC 439]